ncbi:3'-5' exonuclease [Inquilinus sp. Marseille-Q2685]|uniref:3'-5' exonuclease n=1 Tax=Inquilinus sp. Marseille-Q2685 TaxID=2866581 RepID=UPI001CE3DCC6|nr:3'-5' exonuclease [Inquilinus sp. Marseille-Q2685]
MTLLYASTFQAALGRLTAQEQKQVKVTTFDLMLDPRGNGLQMHRIEKTDGFWSVRVSQDLRIILHKAGDATLLAYVDHHDAAYRWAERRRLVPHERTGAMQFVEIREVVEEERVSAPVRMAPARRLFAALTDDQLLDVGVPREWLAAVRETTEDDLFTLLEALPAEASEALLDYAAGGRIEDHVAFMALPHADPFAHPDAQRRFRAVDGVEELRAALDAPFEQWAVFLHPTQRAPVERRWSGPVRVSGSAGTGKTIVALHRAVHLARRNADASVLLTTFSDSLAAALAAKVEILTAAEPALRARIAVRALDRAALEIHERAFGPATLASADQIRAAIKAAKDEGLGAGLTPEFLFEEWEEVVDAWALADEESYATVPRLGRKTRLGAKQRAEAWAVFAFLRARLAEQALLTWPALYGRLTDRLAGGSPFPYTHIVVDEAQDLTVAQARFLAAAGQGGAEALFFAGDLGQRIFHLPFSWARLGIDIRGRSQTLKVCYRTSHQIRTAADRLLPSAIADLDGIEEGRRGTVSVFDGPPPEIALAEDEAEETARVAGFLRGCLESGMRPGEIGVLVRGPGQLDRARAAAEGAGEPGVVIATMHDAKGLEFRAVAVMACDEDVIPDPARLAAVGDSADLEAVHDTERHLLYVAFTRARDRLLVSGLKPGSEFIDDVK